MSTDVQNDREAQSAPDVKWLRARLSELHAVRRVLRPDRDDPAVLSELTTIERQIRTYHQQLQELNDNG